MLFVLTAPFEHSRTFVPSISMKVSIKGINVLKVGNALTVPIDKEIWFLSHQLRARKDSSGYEQHWAHHRL